MNSTWEENVFAGLEELDRQGEERVSRLAPAPERESEEPTFRTGEMPELGELKLEAQPPRLA